MKKLLTFASFILYFTISSTYSYALVRFDFEQKYFCDPGHVVKDHSLIRRDDTYHLFYLRGDPAWSIGHATSTDLIHWHLEEPVLTNTPGSWNELGLWAPHVRNFHGEYYMYFTGVNANFAQQSGMAQSPDLFNWYQYPDPKFHPDPSWALWNESSWSNGRDPFVFEYNGFFYMLVTAKTNTNLGAIGSAISTDLEHWQDNGPIYVHDSWHALESPQLVQRDGKFHLFFTEEVINGTSVMTSDSLYSGWDINQRQLIDAGHAPEVKLFDGNYIISRHTIYNDNHGNTEFTIVLDTLKWSGDLPYVYKPWPLGDQWNYVSGSAFLYQPTYGDNPYARGDTIHMNYEGKCWIGTYERFQGPLKYGSPGGSQGDGAKGLIRSDPFTVTGNSMTLWVGGGNYPDQCYVALVDAANGQKLRTATGKNTDVMDLRTWDIKPFKGRLVYLEIADQSTAVFGHINCDDIEESMIIIPSEDPVDDSKDGKRRIGLVTMHQSASPSYPTLYQNSPNPFSPSTAISYFLPSEAAVRIDIFDVSGKRIARLIDRSEGQGMHTAEWHGTNAYGERAAAGIYFYRLTINGRTVDTKKMVFIK
jgi:sucrose-6-phosphate hydrolase SacC (GH32 family)